MTMRCCLCDYESENLALLVGHLDVHVFGGLGKDTCLCGDDSGDWTHIPGVKEETSPQMPWTVEEVEAINQHLRQCLHGGMP
jgi:hypothetical protein